MKNLPERRLSIRNAWKIEEGGEGRVFVDRYQLRREGDPWRFTFRGSNALAQANILSEYLNELERSVWRMTKPKSTSSTEQYGES